MVHLNTDIRKKIKDYINFVNAQVEKKKRDNDWASKFIKAYYSWKKDA